MANATGEICQPQASLEYTDIFQTIHTSEWSGGGGEESGMPLREILLVKILLPAFYIHCSRRPTTITHSMPIIS